jgi:phospholipid/cholesterol/gamma-HCH transport system substrate-binding protein
VTVLAALSALGWMILKFGGRVANVFAARTMVIEFESERADGVADGSGITYRGIEAGHVTRVWLNPDRKRVHFAAAVNVDPPLPRNLRATIRTASLLGTGSTVSLEPDGEPSSENLREGDVIKAEFVGLGQILPSEFSELAGELGALGRQFRESNIVGHIDEQVQKAGQLIDSLNKIAGDESTRENIKMAIADMREVAGRAKNIAADLEKFAKDVQQVTVETNTTIGEARMQISRAGNNIDSLSRQMGDRLTQIARLLDQFQSIAQKIDQGQGSAGQIVNDPRLYESLVDTSRELNATIKDFKRLVEQWEQEGVSFKLK